VSGGKGGFGDEDDKRPRGARLGVPWPIVCSAVAINKQVLASSGAALNRVRLDSGSSPEVESAMSASTSASPISDQQQLPGIIPAKRKVHACPHPGCPNIYKQAAGLKYHLAHGHPNNPPLQLIMVPPALAQKMSEKVKKSL